MKADEALICRWIRNEVKEGEGDDERKRKKRVIIRNTNPIFNLYNDCGLL